MAIRHLIAAGRIATIMFRDLQSLGAVARSTIGSELAVGNWGDGRVRRSGYGAAR